MHVHTQIRTSRVSLMVCLMLMGIGRGRCQTAEADLKVRLLGKPLFLRGRWSEDRLEFDQAGLPLKQYGQVSFTLAGVDVMRVKLKKDALEVTGTRIGLEFDRSGGYKRVKLVSPSYDGEVSIRIDGPKGTDFSQALDRVFAPNVAALVPSLPVYWQCFATEVLAGPEPPRDGASKISAACLQGKSTTATGASSTAGAAVAHIGVNGVRPPRLLLSGAPAYSPAARMLQYAGSTELYLWVDESGLPSHLRLVRPAGLGLDEEALAAAAKYKFTPAMLSGEPVKVDLYVEIEFRMH